MECEYCGGKMECIDHCPDFGDEWECASCEKEEAYQESIRRFEADHEGGYLEADHEGGYLEEDTND